MFHDLKICGKIPKPSTWYIQSLLTLQTSSIFLEFLFEVNLEKAQSPEVLLMDEASALDVSVVVTGAAQESER